MARQYQQGPTTPITLHNASDAIIASSAVLVLGETPNRPARLAIAAADIPPDQSGTVFIDGCWLLAAKSTDAYVQGQAVCWDTVHARIQATDVGLAAGDLLWFGTVDTDAPIGSSQCRVWIGNPGVLAPTQYAVRPISGEPRPVPYTNPSGAKINPGEIVILGSGAGAGTRGRIAVVLDAILAGETGMVATAGAWDLPVAAASAGLVVGAGASWSVADHGVFGVGETPTAGWIPDADLIDFGLVEAVGTQGGATATIRIDDAGVFFQAAGGT